MSERSLEDSKGQSEAADAQLGRPVYVLQLNDGSHAAHSDTWHVLYFFIRRNAVLIGTITIVGLLCGLLWTYAATRIYRAQVVISVLSDTDDAGGMSSATAGFAGLASLAGVKLGADGSFEVEAIALLRSRSYIEQFISDSQLLPILFSRRWNESEKKWIESPFWQQPTLQDGYEKFNRKVLRVTEDRKSGLVTLQIEWRDRVLAAQWANRLVARADQTLRERAVRQADSAMRFLNSELQKTSVVELRQALYSVIERQTQKRMLANSRPEFAFRVIDPARESDAHRFVSPKKATASAVGMLAGVIVGFIVALLAALGRREAVSLQRS